MYVLWKRETETRGVRESTSLNIIANNYTFTPKHTTMPYHVYHIHSIRCRGYYYFIARVCAAFIRERRLLIPVTTREAIRRETVD